MASPDVIASALVDLAPGYTELFTEYSPVFEKIIQRGNHETLQSYQKEFVVVTGGPGDVTNVPNGSEVIAGGLNRTGQRGAEVAPRLFYAFDVPGTDIDEANGEKDIARLIQHYPDLAMDDFHQRIAQQLVMGNGTNVEGFITWNSDAQYSPKGVAKDGIFEFAAKAAQVDTVFGLPKEGAASGPVTGWYHQYDDITSFASNGLSKMRAAYWKASRQGARTLGDVDLMFCDETWFNNYVSTLNEDVRFVDSRNQKGDPSKPNIREGIAFLNAVMYLEEKIVPADFTTAAAKDGVCYGIHSGSWHTFLVGRGAVSDNKGFFHVRKPVKHVTQDLWRYEIILSLGMYCNNLRSNFVLTGGDTP